MVALGIELLALLLLSCAVPGRTSWLKTIDVAGFQRTLVQKMTKELLLVALDIDPDDNKRKIHEGIAMFDQTLHDMIEGSDAGDIVASPSQLITDKLEEVDDIWHVFEHVVLSNIDTISNMNGTALEELLQVIAEQSNELLSACGVVVGALSDVATLLGFATMGLQQDIAGRQRSYVQMMCKEALFVSLGINVAEHVEILKHTKLLFEASHEGIIVGDSYVGIPVLSSLCTLHQMREVTYSYHNFRPYVMDILNANSNAAGQAVAKRVVRDMMNTSETLFSSMVDAVQLFVNGSEDCDPRAKMVESDWLRYLENLGRLRLLIQQVSMFFAQVASDVEPAAGKVELTVLMAQASQMLRNLIEGSKAESIPAPPTQEIVLQLQHAWEEWSYLETELTQVIRSNVILPDMAARVSQLGASILEEFERVYRLCANMTTMDPPNRPHLLDLTSMQATRLSNVAKDAYFIHYGCVDHPHGEWMNASRAEFMATHWQLLEGSPATDATPELRQVTDVCALQRMKVAADLFHSLEEASLALARGDATAAGRLVEAFPPAVAAIDDAARFFLTGSIECVNASMTTETLMQLHSQAAALATLSQAGSSEIVLLTQNASLGNHTEEAMEQSVLEVLRRLTYGSPNPPVPAPFSQAVLNVFLTRTSPAARSFASSLVSAGNLTEVLLAGAVLLAETEQIRTVILETVAEIDPNYPARRVDAASQQIALASRIYKESLLHHFGFSESTFERDNAIAEFEARLVAIQDLGGELGGIVRDRLDLLAQMSNVQEKWLVFKDHASSPTAQELSSMSRALDALQEELSAALPMLAVKDDEPIPKFPWPAVIYVSVGVGLVLCVCCSIAVVQYRSRAKQDRNKNGVHGIADGV